MRYTCSWKEITEVCHHANKAGLLSLEKCIGGRWRGPPRSVVLMPRSNSGRHGHGPSICATSMRIPTSTKIGWGSSKSSLRRDDVTHQSLVDTGDFEAPWDR